MTDHASRIMAEMQSERAAIGLADGKPLPVEARDRVLNRMCELFIAEAKRKPKKKVSDMTDEDWLISLEHEPALKGLNVRQEVGRAQFWCKQNKRLPTRRFLVNWLNKAEKVVELKNQGATYATGLRPPPPKGPAGWLDWLKTELATISEDHDAHSQLTAALNCQQFSMMPGSWQTRCKQTIQQSA
jgi:hypothetical protein